MSVRVMSQVWETQLPPPQKLVLLGLADCANDEGRAWPSIETLARKSSHCRRTVQRAIKELEEAGHVTRTEVPGRGCRYMVHPRHTCTGDRDTPVTESTPTGDSVTPKPLEPSLTDKETVARRLPSDWSPQKLNGAIAEIVSRWPQSEVDAQLEHFRDHWAQSNQPNARKKDWDAAWRNWLREHDRRRSKGGRNGERTDERKSPIFTAGDRLDKLYGAGSPVSEH